jgi:DNA-binding transcriptional LysR family regulator
MELHQLAYLVAVAEEASFTRAAARSRVAQPAVSQQIRRLEAELGEPLFDRSDRHISLTAAGAALLPHARAALAAVEDARSAVAAIRGVLTGRLTIGVIQAAPEIAVRALGEFHRRYPDVDLTLKEGERHSEQLVADVVAGQLDAAIIGMGGRALPPGVAVLPLAHEPVVLAVASDHPIARLPAVPLSALRDLAIVTLTAGSGLRALLEAACQDVGFVPRISAETSDVMLLGDLAYEGLGVALLPRSVAEGARRPLAIVELEDPALLRRVVVIWNSQRSSPAGRAFLDVAHQAVAAVP